MSVYRINLPDDYYYYGSTASSLKERMWCHKAHCKVYPERRLYQHIKSWDDITIELIETIDGDRTLRREREQYFIDLHKGNPKCLNQYDSYDTPESKRQKRTESQRERRSNLTDEEKEQRRIRHNEQQKIRRNNK